MKFICKDHGEVAVKKIYYSWPLQGPCPICGEMLEDIDDDPLGALPKEVQSAYGELYQKWIELTGKETQSP